MAKSPEELVEKCGFDPEAFAQTVADNTAEVEACAVYGGSLAIDEAAAEIAQG